MSCELGGLLNEKETTLSPGASLSPPSERHMGHQGRTRRGRGSWGLGWVPIARRPREPSKKGPGPPGIPGGPNAADLTLGAEPRARPPRPASAHAPRGRPRLPHPLPTPPSPLPPRPLTIVTGAVGPGPAPARSDPVREGAAGATGWLRRWVERRGPRGRGDERRIHPTAPQTRG